MASKKPKAQTSLEYLITYGWALVAIATIIGVLVMVASDSVGSNTCHASLAFVCKGVTTQDDTVIMKLQNLTAQTITINPYDDIKFDGQSGYAIILFQGTEYRFEDVTIRPGQEFIIKGQGQVHADQVTITYYAHQTGLTDTETITMNTNADPNIEISNDGEDTDGDGLVDCADPDVTGTCEYTVIIQALDCGTANCDTSTGVITINFQSDQLDKLVGSWEINSAYLYIDVDSVSSPNVKAQIGTDLLAVSDNLVTGWNSIFIENFTATLGNSIDLESDSGDFTISGTELGSTPKLIITLQPSGGGM